jgi:hypothetical protein
MTRWLKLRTLEAMRTQALSIVSVRFQDIQDRCKSSAFYLTYDEYASEFTKETHVRQRIGDKKGQKREKRAKSSAFMLFLPLLAFISFLLLLSAISS